MISKEYLELNLHLHSTNKYYGTSGRVRAKDVEVLAATLNTKDLLDYGCGKGTLASSLPFPIQEYDPAVVGKDKPPLPADLVVCTDVLEHIEPDYLSEVLADLARCTKKMGYFAIHTGPAKKFLRDGRNAHLIQQNKEWWQEKILEYFVIKDIVAIHHEVQVWVTPRLEDNSL